MGEDVLRVAVVFAENICRSPIAEVIIRHQVDDDASPRDRVVVTSAGTANWRVGRSMDQRARAALDRAGYHGPGMPAAFTDHEHLRDQDVIIVMAREHLHEVRGRLSEPSPDVVLLRDFEGPDLGLDVADPYYGDDGDFDGCRHVINRSLPRLTSEFRRRLGAGSF
jgi:protein-tyrosine phosphatase